VLGAVARVVAAACPPALHAGHPRFEARGAEVLDRASGLLWQRCSAGQRYDEPTGRCLGDAQLMRPAEARRHARALGAGWRLPRVAELRSLVDLRCGVPAIDPKAFPGFGYRPQQGMPYWSGTAFDQIPTMNYVVDFVSGDIDVRTRGYPLGVVLVRGPP